MVSGDCRVCQWGLPNQFKEMLGQHEQAPTFIAGLFAQEPEGFQAVEHVLDIARRCSNFDGERPVALEAAEWLLLQLVNIGEQVFLQKAQVRLQPNKDGHRNDELSTFGLALLDTLEHFLLCFAVLAKRLPFRAGFKSFDTDDLLAVLIEEILDEFALLRRQQAQSTLMVHPLITCGPLGFLAGGFGATLAAVYALEFGIVLHRCTKGWRPTGNRVDGVQAASQKGKPVGR